MNAHPVHQNVIAKAEHNAPSYLAVSNVEEAQAYQQAQSYLDDAEYQDALYQGDYVLDLNKAQSSHSLPSQIPVTNALTPVHEHHAVPANVFHSIPRNEQPDYVDEVSHLPSPAHRQHVAAQFAAHDASLNLAPERGQTLNYQLGSPVSSAKYHAEPTQVQHVHVAQPVSRPSLKTQAHVPSLPKPELRQKTVANPPRHEYKPIAAVPVSHIDQRYQEARVSNGIAGPSQDANLRAATSIYEEVNLPTLQTKEPVGHRGHHQKKSQHHESHDEDHYLDKLIKIANGELGDKYEVVKDKHNPHKARKHHNEPAVHRNPIPQRPASTNGYLPSPTVEAEKQPQFNHFKASEHKHEAKKIHVAKEDPYYEVEDTKPYDDEKYINPAAHHRNQFESSKSLATPAQKDPYYEVPKPAVAHQATAKAAHEENSYIQDSEQKYRNPASQYGSGYEIQKLRKPSRTTESPYYDADIVDIEEESRGSLEHRDDYDYNGLKSEDRYFNVPLASDAYGGPELSLIGVAEELPSPVVHHSHHEDKHPVEHHKEDHHDKYKGAEVYSVTNLKKTNVGSGKELNGAGFATKDGFFYTRTEEYNPSKSSKEPILQSFEGYQRPAKYTEVTNIGSNLWFKKFQNFSQ